MAGNKGAKQNIGVTHREVLSWLRTAKVGDDFRAGKGLYLRKTASGAFWSMRFLSPTEHVQRRVPLWDDLDGVVLSFPEASLEEANSRAARIRALVAAGTDPVTTAQDEAEADLRAAVRAAAEVDEARRLAEIEAQRRVSVRTLFDRWAASDLMPQPRADGTRKGRKDGGEFVRLQFERRVFPVLGDITSAEVKKADLMGILDAVKSEGKLRTANVLLADLKQMFAFALDREIVERNPLDTVRKRKIGGADVARDRVLSADEIKALSAALPLANLNQRSVCAIWLILATGSRIGELMGATWEDPAQGFDALARIAEDEGVKVGFVDTKAGTWYMPDTKNQRPHTIHLSAFALEQFKTLRQLRDDLKDSTTGQLTPWVFPATDNRKPVCVKSFGKQLSDRQRDLSQRMKNRTKHTEALRLSGGRWTAHDLRRTAATIMAELGVSGDVIDEALNHKIESKVRRVYIRDRREADQARAFDALGARLVQLRDGSNLAANVVALQRDRTAA